jgi:Transport protein Avl9
MCLPDGAHASEEEFIYFHLPPVPTWPTYPQTTMFGLACFRQIDAKDLLHTTTDVTRTKVQKSVVVLASAPVLGSVRSKLGMVTQAFFAQRDFSKVDILNTLYENLNRSIRPGFPEVTLYMGT